MRRRLEACWLLAVVSAHEHKFGTLRPSGNSSGCPSCPWDRPELGPYPPPSNAAEFSPVHRGRSFDVYGHWIETHYSEVFWTAQPPVPLPSEVVEEFRGRAISITGFEVDVVAGGEQGEPEWSVPEFQVYNHHYCVTIVGEHAAMAYIGRRAQDSLLKDDKTRRRRRAIEVHPPSPRHPVTPSPVILSTCSSQPNPITLHPGTRTRVGAT